MKITKTTTVDEDRLPVPGEVIRIDGRPPAFMKRRGLELVVKSGREVSEDHLRGDRYWCDYFVTISAAHLNRTNPTEYTYVLKANGGMSLPLAEEVDGSQIRLETTIKFKREQTVKYTSDSMINDGIEN